MKNNLPLLFTVVEVTDRCNLRCLHCYNFFNGKTDLSSASAKLIAKELVKLGCKRVTISGGEPLLLGKTLFRLVKFFTNKGMRASLVTNGTLLSNFSPDMFSQFSSIQISLDGPREIHDRIRGEGTFSKILEGIKTLQRGKVAFSLMMVINHLNYKYLKEVKKFADKVGAPLYFERSTNIGRGKNLPKLPKREWAKVMKEAYFLGIQSGCPIYQIFTRLNKKLNPKTNKVLGCAAGKIGLAITTTLDVLPCVRLRIPLGNLKGKSLKEIWKNAKLLTLLRKRGNLKGNCGGCKYREFCGGCRATAYAQFGDILEEDPECWIKERG